VLGGAEDLSGRGERVVEWWKGADCVRG
jgi:hypothetical protein